MVYPVLLPLMRKPRLPVVDWTGPPADLNGHVRFVERRNLVSARVPSHFKRSLPLIISLPSMGKYELAHTRPVMWRLPCNLRVEQNSSVRIRNVSGRTVCMFGMLTQNMHHGKHFSENLLNIFLRTSTQNTGKLPKVQCWTERKYRTVIVTELGCQIPQLTGQQGFQKKTRPYKITTGQ